MPFNKLGITVLATILTLLLSGCSDSNKETAKPATKPPAKIEAPLIIGVIGPETGDEARFGTSVVEGVLAAAKRFNSQGGVGGKEIQVLHFDDKSNIEIATQIVKDLIAQKVTAILAAPTGSSTFAPIHLVNESKTLFISIGTRRHLKASGPFVFRTAVPDDLATEDLIKHAITDLKYSNFGLVTVSDSEFSLDLSSMFMKAVDKQKGEIVARADIYDTISGSHNMGAAINALKQSPKPLHAIIYTGGVSDGIQLAQEMRKAGINLPIIGGEDLFSEEYLKGGDAVTDTLMYTTFSKDSQSRKMAEFMADYGKENPDRFAALAYDTFMLVADAIKEADSADTEKIREALINRKDCEGVTGKTSFTSDNLPVKHPIICKIRRSESGERGFILKSDAPAATSVAPTAK